MVRRLLWNIGRMKPTLIALILIALFGTVGCKRTPQEKAAQFLSKGKEYVAQRDYARAVLQFKNASQLQPKDAETAYQLGLAYLGARDLNHAVASLFRATQLDPHHAGARAKIAELMARSGDPSLAKEGEKRMRELLESVPGNIDALNALALSELALGESQSAEEHLKEALQRFPKNQAATTELALTYLQRQDFQKAEQVLKNARSAMPESLDAALSLAQFYVLTQRWPDAEGAFQSALRISPNDGAALSGLAATELRLGRKSQAEQAYRKLAALPDKRYQHLHAAYLFAEGQRDAAIKEFEALAKKSPGDRDSRSRLVAAYLATGRTADAESVLAAALKAHPNDTDALLQRSWILLRSGKAQEAQDDLNKVIHFQRDSAAAHYLLAQVYQVQGLRSQQNAELTDALRYNPALLPARVTLAQTLTLSGSPQAALDVVNSAPKEQSQALILSLERNAASYAAGDKEAFHQGVALALKAARVPDTLLQDAVVKLIDRAYAAARSSASEALKQSPDNIRALRAIAFSYAAQNQAKEASRFLTDYAAQSKSPAVHLLVGEWFWSVGDRGGARSAFNRAKILDPQSVPANLALARTDMADRNLGQARKTLMLILSSDPRNFAAEELLGAVEVQAGNFSAALECYQKALQLQPNNPQVLNNLAYILADKAGQADEALPYAQQAVDANPANPDAVGTLGWVFYRKGLYREAQQQLQRATAEDRNSTQKNAVIRKYHLAMVYLRLGDKQKGREILLQALQMDSSLPEAQMAQSLIP